MSEESESVAVVLAVVVVDSSGSPIGLGCAMADSDEELGGLLSQVPSMAQAIMAEAMGSGSQGVDSEPLSALLSPAEQGRGTQTPGYL